MWIPLKVGECFGKFELNSQIRQLRILAEAALTQYDIGNARLSLLSHRKDTVFRVTSYPRSGWTGSNALVQAEEERFVLHLLQSRWL